jgi:hypothetical protein
MDNQLDDVERQKGKFDPVMDKKDSLVAIVSQIAICA